MNDRAVGVKEAIKRRKFIKQSIGVSLIYVSLGLGMIFLGGHSELSDSLWRGAMLLGLLSMIYVQVRWYLRGDEFERAIELRAAGIGFISTLVASAVFAFLGPESGQVQHAGFITFFVGFLFFCIARFKFIKGIQAA